MIHLLFRDSMSFKVLLKEGKIVDCGLWLKCCARHGVLRIIDYQ